MNKYLYWMLMTLTIAFILMMTMTATTYNKWDDIEFPKDAVDKKIKDDNNKEPLSEAVSVSDKSKDTKENTEVTTTFTQINKSPYKELLEENNDYRGWIKVNGTGISYPIVKGDDNDYYLKRAFDRSYNTSGTIFMDYRNLGFGFSQHMILYGHNMKDGTMFGDLKRYKNEAYALDNRVIEIEDFYGTRYFEIYASYYAAADSTLITTEFVDKEAYHNFIKDQILRSAVDYGLRPNEDSYILTLVTCSYEVDNGRYLVHAVEVDGPI